MNIAIRTAFPNITRNDIECYLYLYVIACADVHRVALHVAQLVGPVRVMSSVSVRHSARVELLLQLLLLILVVHHVNGRRLVELSITID